MLELFAAQTEVCATEMLVREYHESDLERLRAIHAAQGFTYPFPDLTNPLFVTKLVLSDVNVAPGFSPASSPAGTATKDAALKGGATQDAIPTASKDSDVSTAGNCRIVGAALLRLTAEAYLLLDPQSGTPRERWQGLLALHAAAERDAWRRGLEDVHAWLPPPIAAKFGKRLARLGWIRDDTWTPFCYRLGQESVDREILSPSHFRSA